MPIRYPRLRNRDRKKGVLGGMQVRRLTIHSSRRRFAARLSGSPLLSNSYRNLVLFSAAAALTGPAPFCAWSRSSGDTERCIAARSAVQKLT
jgi:hypothetical protein